MLLDILEVLRSLAQGIVAILKFIPKLLADLVMIVKLTAETAARLPTLFQIFPGVLSSILISILGVVVLYKVMGREG